MDIKSLSNNHRSNRFRIPIGNVFSWFYQPTRTIATSSLRSSNLRSHWSSPYIMNTNETLVQMNKKTNEITHSNKYESYSENDDSLVFLSLECQILFHNCYDQLRCHLHPTSYQKDNTCLVVLQDLIQLILQKCKDILIPSKTIDHIKLHLIQIQLTDISMKSKNKYIHWNHFLELINSGTCLRFGHNKHYLHECERLSIEEYQHALQSIDNFTISSESKISSNEKTIQYIEKASSKAYSSRFQDIQKNLEQLSFSASISPYVESSHKLVQEMELKANELDKSKILINLKSYRFYKLSSIDKEKIQEVFDGKDMNEEFIYAFATSMTRSKLLSLRPGRWLNDEIINFYYCMLQKRDYDLYTKDSNRLKSHYFSSFFMEKLLNTDHCYNYDYVKRWSKKFDIFSLHRIFIPINLNNTHWTLGKC